MNIIKDRDLIWDVGKYDVILVGTNICCSLHNGFQSKIKVKYPPVNEANNTRFGDKRKFGKRLTIYDTNPIISLLYIAKRVNHNKDYLDYDALKSCLISANIEFYGKKVATTVIGASQYDGMGDKNTVMKIIQETTTDLDLYIYDYEQLDKKNEALSVKRKIKQYETTDLEKFNNLWAKRNEIYKSLYLDYTDGKTNKK